MSKIVMVGDCHAGARTDSQIIANNQFKFFEEVLFPYVEDNDIKDVVLMGDVFDRRKNTSHDILHQWKDRVFSKLDSLVNWYIVVGNHDLPFKNSTTINSPALFLSDYKRVVIISDPTDIDIGGVSFLMLPWICSGNEAEALSAIKATTSHYCCGHLELAGFQMNKGYFMEEGMDKALLSRFDKVFSGHYHTQSSDGNIFYLGTPYELTWIDADDPKGFWSFDTSSHGMDFIKNPNTIFNKLFYDDSVTTPIVSKCVKDTYVKIVVSHKKDQAAFDKFVERVNSIGVADLKVLDDLQVSVDDTEIDDDLGDTGTLIDLFCDQVETSLDRQSFKTLMQGLYVEALSTID